jgi:hypothetical protein
MLTDINKNSIYIVTNVFIPFMAAYFLSELFRNIDGIAGLVVGVYKTRNPTDRIGRVV